MLVQISINRLDWFYMPSEHKTFDETIPMAYEENYIYKITTNHQRINDLVRSGCKHVTVNIVDKKTALKQAEKVNYQLI